MHTNSAISIASANGTKRTSRDVCYESVMRSQADVDQEPPVVDLAGDHHHHVACTPINHNSIGR